MTVVDFARRQYGNVEAILDALNRWSGHPRCHDVVSTACIASGKTMDGTFNRRTNLEMLCTRNCRKSRSAAIMGLCASILYALESMATAHTYLLNMQDMALLAFAGSSVAGEDQENC